MLSAPQRKFGDLSCVGDPDGQKLVAGGGASFTSATTGKLNQTESAPEGAGAYWNGELLAPPSGRIPCLDTFRWLRSLHSLHHRLPAFGPPDRRQEKAPRVILFAPKST